MSFESDLARKVIAAQADALPTAFGRITISLTLLRRLLDQLEAAELAVGFQAVTIDFMTALCGQIKIHAARQNLITALWRRAATMPRRPRAVGDPTQGIDSSSRSCSASLISPRR